MTHLRLKYTVAATLALFASASACAASVDPSEFAALAAEARQNGAAAVVVHLAPVSLQQLSSDLHGVNAAMSTQATRLMAELGTHAWQGGRWDNGIGQIGLYVTESGLKFLQNSSNAVSFARDQGWMGRTPLDGADGRHAEIERRLANDGVASVVVTLNVDGLEYAATREGGLAFFTSTRQIEEARTHTDKLLRGLGGKQAAGKSAALAQLDALVAATGTSRAPEIVIQTDREGLIQLSQSKLIRSLRPQGFKDPRPTRFDDEALVLAAQQGDADVVITVRNPLVGGSLSKESLDAQTRSNKRTLDGLLADLGIHASLQDLSLFGAASGRLSTADLLRLKSSGDARLLSVELNRPMGTVQLATSTATMNMPSAWNAGFRAAGQNVIVMDSGVLANHQFLANASGASRVVLEACFGTNQLDGGVNYRSRCPSPNASGDSALGLVGSAAPVLNCSTAVPNACHHGTHVAGIAAGRGGPSVPPGLQGVAPDANVIAVQVFSFDAAGVAPPTAFLADILAAMQTAANAMAPNSTQNANTINLSLGSGAFPSACPTADTAFTTAVQTLFNAGVPVVAATGNDGINNAIAWPACVPRVIKVGAVNNDGIGTTRSTFTNLAKPANFPGDFFWLTPGGGGSTSVQSSINSAANAYGRMEGTSQATPHVAGLYAAIKAAIPGVSVNDASLWIQNNASLPVSVNLCTALPCAPSDTVTFRRIRLPNL